MAKMKIFELKNLINSQTNGKLESKDIQDYLEKSMGVKKTHSSNLEEHEVKMVKERYLSSTSKASTTSTSKSTSPIDHGKVTVSGSTQRQTAKQTSVSETASQGVKTMATEDVRPSISGQQVNRPASQGTSQSQGAPAQRAGHNQVYHAGGTQRPVGQQNSVQHNQSLHNAGIAHRPTGESRSMEETRQSSQGQSRPTGQGNTGQRTQGNTQGQRSGQSQAYHAGGQRQQRPQGEGYQGNRNQGSRPQGEGYQGNRNQGSRPQGEGYQGNRNQGSRPQGEGYQGNRPRPQGEGYQGRPQGEGYQGNRPRPQGEGYQGRPQGEGYQGNRNNGPRPQGEGGYQGNRNNQRPYNNNGQGRPQGEGYQGNRPRPQGEGYQGRPQGEGYQGNRNNGPRPYNNNGQGRPQGEGYQGNRNNGPRPQGEGGGYQGNRTGGARPYNNNGQGQGGYSRPAGGQGGQRPGGFSPRGGFDGGFNKDEDDKPAYNRGQGAKKGSGRGGSERKNFDQQILDQKVAEKSDNKRSRDRINKDKLYKDKGVVIDDFEDEKTISKIAPRKGQFIQPKPVIQREEEIKTIIVPEVLTIKELADKMKMPPAVLVKKLFLAGKMVSINSEITFEEAEEIALEYEIIAEKEVKVNEVEELLKEEAEDETKLVKRPPVVCVMGHVDHGKTSLLDAIRATSVTSREAGGITQHIGAYMVEVNGEPITFLDTPGHEAFTSMRMRGAQATDIAILVVAADDGVMPQTVEAISHAKAAGVQIIVAINKVDKPSANIERVKQELTEYELIAEDWGGDTIFVPVSAHTREGINQLLEMIVLTAELAELKANPDRKARGLVIEAELDKGRGPVATILVQKGTLQVGDTIAVGSAYGKVRAMIDDKGRRVKEAVPSTPVEILGLNEVPGVGEIFVATDSEKEARTIAEAFITQGKERLIGDTKAKLSLDGLFSQIQAGNVKDLNLIVKADVQGSVEAMKQSLLKLSNDEVAVRIIHGGVGAINESDVILASTSNAVIIGFNVKPDNAAKETADREKIDIKFYRVIYSAIDDVEAAMKGMLDPIFEEKVIGHAEIRQTFKASGIGTIAGSYVTSGKITRGCKARITRDGVLIFDGILASLKRFQDDVKEVATGYECGLVFEKFNDVKEDDKVELYIMAEVPR